MSRRTCTSDTYNYVFNTETGFFARWGKTLKDDPQFSPIGPEILDIEVSTICHMGCKFCYKSNTPAGKNMSLETFKSIIDKMPTVMQVAFGVGDIDANPALLDMMRYCRRIGVVPNITVNPYRMSKDMADNLAKICGSIAVSNYNLDACLKLVSRLHYKGAKQVNIHQLLAEETLRDCEELVNNPDKRIEFVNAVVFLSVKQKGRGVGYTPVSQDSFDSLIRKLVHNNARIGFDSCGAHKFLYSIRDYPNYEAIAAMVEPCESGLFSSYVNVDGFYFPCSFSEGHETGIDLSKIDSFVNDVWYSNEVSSWRERLLDCDRKCPLFSI